MANPDPTDTVTLPRHFVKLALGVLDAQFGGVAHGAGHYAGCQPCEAIDALSAALNAPSPEPIDDCGEGNVCGTVGHQCRKCLRAMFHAEVARAEKAEKELEETRLNAWKLADEVAAEEAERRRTAEAQVRDQKQALRLWLHLVSKHGPGGCGIHNPFHDLKTLTEAHDRDHDTDLGNFHHDLADLSHDIVQLGTVLKAEGYCGTYWSE